MSEIIWDHRPLYVFHQTDEATYKIIEKRYNDFLDVCNDVTKEPVRVFEPLKPNLLEELGLIREVSKQLQIKKDEDIKKSQQAESEEEKKDTEVEDTAEVEKTDA